MSHAKRVTRDNRKNPEYHIVAAMRKLRTDIVPQENHGQTMLKMSSTSDLKKTYDPQNTRQYNMMMQRSANKNAAFSLAAFSFAVFCIHDWLKPVTHAQSQHYPFFDAHENGWKSNEAQYKPIIFFLKTSIWYPADSWVCLLQPREEIDPPWFLLHLLVLSHFLLSESVLLLTTFLRGTLSITVWNLMTRWRQEQRLVNRWRVL